MSTSMKRTHWRLAVAGIVLLVAVSWAMALVMVEFMTFYKPLGLIGGLVAPVAFGLCAVGVLWCCGQFRAALRDAVEIDEQQERFQVALERVGAFKP